MADEAGRFAWVLSRRGIDGPRALLVLLQQVDGCDPRAFAPDPERPGWASDAERLCPLATGIALLDRSRLLPALLPLRFQDVLSPVLLAAAVELLWQGCGHVLQLEWDGFRYGGPAGARTGAGDGEALSPAAQDVRLVSLTAPAVPAGMAASRVAVDAATWDALERFAGRTYAPATELSRTRGAG